MTEFTKNEFLIIDKGEYKGETPPEYFKFPYDLIYNTNSP